MDTAQLKKFAQQARRNLIRQVYNKYQQVITEHSAARRENPKAVRELEIGIEQLGEEQLIERVAYIWFNRFCALRFMDVNRYTRTGVVSPAEGHSQPEILADAKMGHIDASMVTEPSQQQVNDLLSGKAPSHDGQGEAYRLLVVAACNYWNKSMPFLFQRINDYTELLMPDDLLSDNSILAHTRAAMTAEACQDVEVIGWLYQFYIAEKKDQVFADLKKSKKITPENIPAATQLFTPHWIVRYMVENSLGRLWMLNHPDSKLVEQMDYYIKPEQAETDFLVINSPEELKICDPACGSGHILTYAFDLLYAIYEESGYDSKSIPEKILTHNLFGIEIDERAGELAAFALTMKARAKQRRFFSKGVKPNICVLENVHFDGNELKDYMDFVGRDLFTAPLQTTLRQFEEADNFGSLIRPDVADVDGMLRILESKNVSGQLFISMTHQKVLQALRQADYLSPRYHVVIANPPYMGGKGMNGRLGSWAKDNYPASKADLFAMFIERGLELVPRRGYSAMVTMQSWMFLSSYESLRIKLMGQTAIESMAHMANMVMGIAFGTAATVWKVGGNSSTRGSYCYIEYENLGVGNKPTSFPPHNERNQKASGQGWFHRAYASDFKKIPGCPIAYWVNKAVLELFVKNRKLEDISKPRQGATTSDNNRFLRIWNEVSFEKFGVDHSSLEAAANSRHKWFPYNKGGDFRRWYGNQDFAINYENDGEDIKEFHEELNKTRPGGRLKNQNYYFKPCVSWSKISSGTFAARYFPAGFIFDVAGSAVFFKDDATNLFYDGLLNTSFVRYVLAALSPTLNFEAEHLCKIPVAPEEKIKTQVLNVVGQLVAKSKVDWDAYETSWDFTSLPLLNPDYHQPTLKATYQKIRAHWLEMTLEMQRLEEENNRIFIDAYGLQDEFKPDVPLNEITLTCNPHYRYGNDKSEDDLEALLLADTMRELVSYAVGCMLGRYALDKPGLILANQGETIEDYLKQVPEPSFPADDDNVIPILDGDWFTDDITERFRTFLKVSFGEAHYEENLQFVEQGLNIKNRRNYSIRDYFLKEFYNDHVKRYKKRPIYWLFSSPKGNFNALIYMHRYRPDTISVILNDYLREYRTKLSAYNDQQEAISLNPTASSAEKTRALKEIEKTKKILNEISDYEKEALYPLATEKVEIDLDDGVKANYPKFGAALKKVVGLSPKSSKKK